MINEAIENIREIKKLDCHIKYPEWQLALTLGIEALERVKYNSTARFGEYDYSPLPSEGEK